ncbi:hypothetical protein HanXRQr2_Chr15g0678711 [Helianthus annuus]|uniref:Uncharacterized protein n=1 Tax=Helianthus annuus TaxID=4232 RepID=A0A9K3DXB4_HELAN|nr:hypothetical protein HanXRQr2_Chr15g0678711 [Helianthus annuus]KAJ0830041.1 hypothetical protein HanPSC8_Chr15g0650661 [Helianthus annuus]
MKNKSKQDNCQRFMNNKSKQLCNPKYIVMKYLGFEKTKMPNYIVNQCMSKT